MDLGELSMKKHRKKAVTERYARICRGFQPALALVLENMPCWGIKKAWVFNTQEEITIT